MNRNKGHAAVATAEPQLSLIPVTDLSVTNSGGGKFGQSLYTSNTSNDDD